MADLNEPKKETVRITLPPRTPTKPASEKKDTVRINLPTRPPGGGTLSGAATGFRSGAIAPAAAATPAPSAIGRDISSADAARPAEAGRSGQRGANFASPVSAAPARWDDPATNTASTARCDAQRPTAIATAATGSAIAGSTLQWCNIAAAGPSAAAAARARPGDQLDPSSRAAAADHAGSSAARSCASGRIETAATATGTGSGSGREDATVARTRSATKTFATSARSHDQIFPAVAAAACDHSEIEPAASAENGNRPAPRCARRAQRDRANWSRLGLPDESNGQARQHPAAAHATRRNDSHRAGDGCDSASGGVS